MPRSLLRALFRRGLAILLILIVITPAGARSVAGQSDDGLTGDQRYESPQLGYEVTWDDPWIVGERATRSRDVREDRLVLVHDDTGAELLVHGRFTEDTPQEVVDGIVEDRVGEFEDVVVEDQGRQSGVARAVLSYTSDDGDVHEYLEASSLEEDESVLLVDLIAPSGSFDDTVDALGVVELDGEAVFSEAPSLPSGSRDDATATPPEDEGPNRRRPRLPTDDAAEEPTEEPTEEAEAEDAVDGNTFTSPNFGFSISWDEDVWEVTATATDPDFDQLVLDTRDSSLSLSGTTDFDGDVGECLEGVTAFLSAGTEALEIDDIDVLDDEDGDPIEGEERDRAFVANEYTGTFEGDDAQFVYYVECRTLVPEESVLVVIHFVLDPEDYPDEAEAREEILDTLETEGTNGGRDDERTPTPEDDEATATPEEDDDPTATPEDAETPPPGDRATFESDAYPFTLSWDPDIWEETASDDAGVVLTDGPSSLTITAVDDYEGDSVACVQGQVDEIGGVEGVTSVEAETGENGRRVSGGNSERFFALYRVTASDGTFGGTNDVLVYLECRTLVENDVVLAVSHIVFIPDLYEREAARAENVLETIEMQE